MGPPADHSGDGDPSPTRVRYGVLAWLCAAAVIAYIQRNCIGVAEEAIRVDLELTREQMGQVMGAFFLTYAVFQIPTGWIGHVWGSRRALPLFSALWSVSTGLAVLGGFPMLYLTRLSTGAAQAGIFPCSTVSLAKWFPPTRRSLASGALGSSMSVGAALAAVLTGLLLDVVGWRWLFFLVALPGLAWAVGFYLWFRDRPGEHPAVNPAELQLLPPDAEPAGAPREPTPWRAIFTSPALGWICAQQFFRAAAYVFYTSWFATFLKETRGVTTAMSGLLNSLPLLAVVLGSVLGGLFCDWVLVRTGSRRLSRQGVSSLSLVICAALILSAYFVVNVWLAVLIISLGSFFASFAGAGAYTISIDMGGKQVATVFSTMNMSGNIGGWVFPVIVPYLVTLTGNWDLVLFVFAGIYLAAALCWLPFNPNQTIGEHAVPEPSRS